jgi:hypothetical protein
MHWWFKNLTLKDHNENISNFLEEKEICKRIKSRSRVWISEKSFNFTMHHSIIQIDDDRRVPHVCSQLTRNLAFLISLICQRDGCCLEKEHFVTSCQNRGGTNRNDRRGWRRVQSGKIEHSIWRSAGRKRWA